MHTKLSTKTDILAITFKGRNERLQKYSIERIHITHLYIHKKNFSLHSTPQATKSIFMDILSNKVIKLYCNHYVVAKYI